MNAVSGTPVSKSIPVELISHQFQAFHLSKEPDANRTAVTHLRQEAGLDCSIHNEGLVVFSPKTVDAMRPGDVLIYANGKFVEILSENDYNAKYQPAQVGEGP